MTPIAQLIAELRELAKRGAALSDQLMDMYADPHIDNLTFSAAKHIARLEAAMLSAAEALARQEELLAEALADFEAIAGRENECGNSQWDPKEGRWQPIRDMARRAAARLSDKLKGG